MNVSLWRRLKTDFGYFTEGVSFPFCKYFLIKPYKPNESHADRCQYSASDRFIGSIFPKTSNDKHIQTDTYQCQSSYLDIYTRYADDTRQKTEYDYRQKHTQTNTDI
ncbi:MAG: hypothetical protein JNL70_24285 [Saprospiraceae bacterium]|nr:hypothetical protein [Saprospiraceae bacterium]